MSYVLFYSNYCPYSKKFINILDKSGESIFFSKVCVDIIPQIGKRTAFVKKHNITEVPTILVNSNKFVGKTAFNWLKNKIESTEKSVSTMNTRQNTEGRDNKAVQDLNNKIPEQNNSIQGFDFQNSFLKNTSDDYEIIGKDEEDQFKNNPSFNKMLCDQMSNKGSIQDSQSFIQGGSQNGDLNAMTQERSVPDQLKTISISKDKLKSKQIENRYNQLLNERNSN